MDEGRSDLNSITGKDPAVYGFDIGNLSKGWAPSNGHIVQKIKEVFRCGCIATVVWHPENPLTLEGFHSGSPVHILLPGAAGNRILVDHLNLIADFLGNLRDENAHSIPVIFRPWHESNDGRFWWGDSRCTADEYIRLYRFTVTYLRDVRKVRNFLYAFSPSLGTGFQESLARYPGHNFVDIIGLNAYGDLNPNYQTRLLDNLRALVRYAEENGKVPAVTAMGFKKSDSECGLKYCSDLNWLTQMLASISGDPIARRISYIVFWRNEAYNPNVYYLAHPGSPHEGDLIAACADPYVVLGDRLGGLYKGDTEVTEI